jgi:hypothetical protein
LQYPVKHIELATIFMLNFSSSRFHREFRKRLFIPSLANHIILLALRATVSFSRNICTALYIILDVLDQKSKTSNANYSDQAVPLYL